MKKMFAAAVACALLAVPVTAAALEVDGGILTGAKGVTVGSQVYDVSFVDGSCSQVYGSCKASSFDFANQSDAIAAGNALLNQVLIDGPSGNFDSIPLLTRGCVAQGRCTSIIAYRFSPGYTQFIDSVYVNNDVSTSTDAITTGSFGDGVNTSDPVFGGYNFARFTLAATAVPEPATWAMFIGGFGLIGAGMRRRQRTTVSFA